MPYPSFCIHESQEPDIVFVMYTLLRTTHIVPENLNLNICVNTQNKSNIEQQTPSTMSYLSHLALGQQQLRGSEYQSLIGQFYVFCSPIGGKLHIWSSLEFGSENWRNRLSF